MILGLIPSRLNSKRLKNKALLKINGLSLIEILILRLQKFFDSKQIIICTSRHQNNYFLKKKLKVIALNSPVRRLTDSWQGKSEIGKKIISRKSNPKLIKDFNKFHFLRDLKAEGSIKSRSIARSLVANWIDERHNLLSKEFNAQIMAERITCLSFNYSWFAESGKLDFQKKLKKFMVTMHCKLDLEVKSQKI